MIPPEDTEPDEAQPVDPNWTMPSEGEDDNISKLTTEWEAESARKEDRFCTEDVVLDLREAITILIVLVEMWESTPDVEKEDFAKMILALIVLTLQQAVAGTNDHLKRHARRKKRLSQ